jgi:predicted ATPase
MHFERARDHRRASHHLARATDNALQRVAYREALDYADRGLELLARTAATPERSALELQLLMSQTVARFTLGGHGAPGVEDACRRAQALCAEVDQPDLLGPVLYGLWTIASLRNDTDGVGVLAAQLDEVARRHADPVLEMQAYVMIGLHALIAGRCAAALAHFERCLELYDLPAHRRLALSYGEDPAVAAHTHAAFAEWLLGHSDRARTHAEHACRLAGELGYPNDIWEATSGAMYVHVLCGDASRARTLVQTLLAVFDEYGLTRSIYHLKVVDGWATAMLGEAPSALSELPDGAAELATGTRTNPFIICLRAETLAARGEIESALAAAADAIEIARRNGFAEFEADHVRLRGELLLRADPVGSASAAEEAFTTSLATAREQQARSLELRAATCLARLWGSCGQRDRGRRLLADVVAAFSEGFDTHDLRAASALLAELEPAAPQR